MRAEELSLLYVIDGPRGSGKTLILTHLAIEKLAHAAAVRALRAATGDPNLFPRHKTRVFSNYPIRAMMKIPGMPGLTLLQSEIFDVTRLMTWQAEFHDCYIVYDEIDQDADRQDWMAQLPRYIVKGVKLMRHRNITFASSLQFIDELNIRLYKQADIEIQMRDLAFSPWGRGKRLKTGEVMKTTFIDKSGILTGYSYKESGQSYELKFHGKRYWDNYETTHEFDVLRPKYTVKQAHQEIISAEQAQAQEENRQALFAAISFFKFERPGELIRGPEFAAKLHELGCGWTSHQYGRFLTEIGIERRYSKGATKYDFSNINVDNPGVAA